MNVRSPTPHLLRVRARARVRARVRVTPHLPGEGRRGACVGACGLDGVATYSGVRVRARGLVTRLGVGWVEVG